MGPLTQRAVIFLSLLATLSEGSIVYVTDLTLFTELAPCAATQIRYLVQDQTYDACPEATDALQSCICSKGNIFASIGTEISSSIASACGSTASDDQASATTVLSAYCDQDHLPTFPTPSIPVSQYIDEIAELSYLAPCAATQLSYAVQGLTDYLCPPEATALATCACQKQQNSLVISQSINLSVKSACSSHTADVSSAQAFFAAYCAMNTGISSFPQPSNPPGDMSYYVTDLVEYSSLAPCAATGLGYGIDAGDLCPEGPQALASCICIKEGMSVAISSAIRSSVKYGCSSGNTEDVTSALAVMELYCSAARREVVPAGVTASVAQPTVSGKTGVFGTFTGPTATGTAATDKDGNKSGAEPSSGGPKTITIVGAAVGVVLGLSLIAMVVFFVMRNARRKRNAMPTPIVPLNSESPGDFGGKSELAGVPVGAANLAPPGSPSPSMMKHGHSPITNSVSPVSAHSSAYPPPSTPELPGQNNHPPMPQFNGMFPPANRPELPGQMYNGNANLPPNHAELHSPMYGNGNIPPPNRPELYGQAYGAPPPNQGYYIPQVYEFPTHNAVHMADSRPVAQRAELMGYQSGPVQQYAELDGGYSRGVQPHAR